MYMVYLPGYCRGSSMKSLLQHRKDDQFCRLPCASVSRSLTAQLTTYIWVLCYYSIQATPSFLSQDKHQLHQQRDSRLNQQHKEGRSLSLTAVKRRSLGVVGPFHPVSQRLLSCSPACVKECGEAESQVCPYSSSWRGGRTCKILKSRPVTWNIVFNPNQCTKLSHMVVGSYKECPSLENHIPARILSLWKKVRQGLWE